MELLEMIFIPFLSLLILFILTKLMGYRQISQLNLYDYIIGITIGSIASEFIMGGYQHWQRPLIAMLVYALFTIFLSKLSINHLHSRKLIEGGPVIIYKEHQIYFKELKKAKMDIDEMLMQCRNLGYFDLKNIDTILLEMNGSLSIFPQEQYRPVVFNDLHLQVQKTSLPLCMIKNGQIMKKNLKSKNKTEQWLLHILSVKGINLQQVLLALYHDDESLELYLYNEKQESF